MPVLSKHALSGSDKGLPISVTATAAAGAQLIHQVAGTATNVIESVSLWAFHGATAAVTTTVAFFSVTNGSTLANTAQFLQEHSAERIPVQAFSQLPLSGTDTMIHTYSTATETYYVWGHVDRRATG